MQQIKLFQDLKRTHVAIMRKSWGLTPKILTGEKTIESRWYKNRCKPWGQIANGDIVYFKDAGEPIQIRATVKKVLQFANLNPDKVKQILKRYAKADGLGVDPNELNKYYQMFKDKKYCLIIFLKNAKKVDSFKINKSGFGAMAAWLIADSIDQIKLKE